MIKNLSISNIALIDKCEIDFEQGLTVLSGETGSGKSIIIDSLAFVLGDRADKTLIKYGEDVAEVTALFEVDENSPVLGKMQEYGFGNDTEILINRKMSFSGKNEIRIQGKTATLSILKEVCSDLVDIFGQGEHLAMLNEKNQLSLLDAFCDFGGVDCKLKDLHSQLGGVNKQLKSFGGDESERERLLDILKYQIDEITNANLDEQEEDELLAKHKRMVNVEKIASALSLALEALDGDNGAVTLVSQANNAVNSIANVESDAQQLADRLTSCKYELQDVSATVEDLLSATEFSPAEVDKLQERLEQIKQIKRKYGGSIAQALEFLYEAQTKYDSLANSAEIIDKLNKQKQQILSQMYDCAKKKSDLRRHTAQQLSAKIMGELADLGMKGTNFFVNFAEQPTFDEYCVSPTSDGYDKVEFLMSANVGEPLKPLAKVISGGEMSRFMLAVKNITALAEHIPTMVFDEIDTGISGNMAQMVANKLANISANTNGYQCIVITHLPQIVAMADDSLYINKFVDDGKTYTQVKRLDSEQLLANEVARLMGNVGENGIASAKDLIALSKSFKTSIVKE